MKLRTKAQTVTEVLAKEVEESHRFPSRPGQEADQDLSLHTLFIRKGNEHVPRNASR
jgi:hypothetical protein